MKVQSAGPFLALTAAMRPMRRRLSDCSRVRAEFVPSCSGSLSRVLNHHPASHSAVILAITWSAWWTRSSRRRGARRTRSLPTLPVAGAKLRDVGSARG